MIRIKKDYNIKIIIIVISSAFLFTNALHAFSFPKQALRVPIGNYNRLELLLGRSPKSLPIYNSMDSMLEGLPLAIFEKLKEMGLNNDDARLAKELLDLVKEVYGLMGLLTENYHNHAHNLAVTYTMLSLTKGLDMSVEDKKVVFIASLFHDFHCRVAFDTETNKGTPALVEETLRQFADILGISEYPGYAIANARYSGENSIIDQTAKTKLKEVISEFLGGEKAIREFYPKIVAMIRRSDFASDAPLPHRAYKQNALNIRRIMDEKINNGTGIDEIIQMVEAEYSKVFNGIEDDATIGDQKNNTKIWLERQKGIELVYLKALGEIKPAVELQLFHKLAHRLEKGADQAGLYYLGIPEMVEREVVQGLNKEIPTVTAAGSYPFFFSIEFLTPEVLTILSNLPEEYKDNFCKVMGHFSRLSTIASRNMPDTIPVKPLFSNAETDWTEKSAKVAYMLNMSSVLLRQSLLGGFLTEEEISRLISEARLKVYSVGITILKKGDAVGKSGVFEILSGKVRINIEEGLSVFLGAGNIFGETAIIRNDPRNATVVVTTEDSIIAEVPSETFLQFYRSNTRFRFYVNSLIKVRSGMNESFKHQRDINRGL